MTTIEEPLNLIFVLFAVFGAAAAVGAIYMIVVEEIEHHFKRCKCFTQNKDREA